MILNCSPGRDNGADNAAAMDTGVVAGVTTSVIIVVILVVVAVVVVVFVIKGKRKTEMMSPTSARASTIIDRDTVVG